MLRWLQPEDSDVKAGKGHHIVNGACTARWDEAKQHFAVFNGGTFVTSAKKEEKARQHVLELSAGTHKSQKKASPGLASCLSTRDR